MQIEDWIISDIPEPIIEQASNWIVQLDHLEQDDHGYLEPEQQAELRQQFYTWLGQHHLHQLAFSQLSEVWARTSTLKHMEELIDKSEVLNFPQMPLPHPHANDLGPLLVDKGEPAAAAPAWMYPVVIGLAVLGAFIPQLF